jgi:hypothetical protein
MPKIINSFSKRTKKIKIIKDDNKVKARSLLQLKRMKGD